MKETKNTKTNGQLTFANESEKMLHKNLGFTALEQYKLLRANLEFTLPEGEECPVIGITSASRNEGKSTTAINLSYVIAERGDKVLLIDGDLRVPSIAKKLGIDTTAGLTDMLKGDDVDVSAFRSSLQENWFVLPSGKIPPNPSELLGSGKMENVLNKLKAEFDYIVIDLPPINVVSDALSVSRFLTGMIVVVHEDHTEKKDFEHCARQLELSHVNVLGCFMTGAKVGGGKYGKYKYGGYYGSKSKGSKHD